jgi:hypothetical protein
VRTALEAIGRSRENRLSMDGEGTAQHWLLMASTALHPVTDAEHRVSASLKMNKVTILAAADELSAATRDAMAWMAANSCPDIELRGRVALMLNTCAEAAHTAQRAFTDPIATNAVIRRLGDLLRIIDFQSRALDDW